MNKTKNRFLESINKIENYPVLRLIKQKGTRIINIRN